MTDKRKALQTTNCSTVYMNLCAPNVHKVKHPPLYQQYAADISANPKPVLVSTRPTVEETERGRASCCRRLRTSTMSRDVSGHRDTLLTAPSTTRNLGRESVDFRIETLDTMHFNLYHLTDVGLRVQADADDDEKATDEDQEQGLVDLAMKLMADKIEAVRAKCFFELIDGGQSSKLTLCAAQQKEDKAEAFLDELMVHMVRRLAKHTSLAQYLVPHEFDFKRIK